MLLTRHRLSLGSTLQDDALYRLLVLIYLMAPGENRILDLYQSGGKCMHFKLCLALRPPHVFNNDKVVFRNVHLIIIFLYFLAMLALLMALGMAVLFFWMFGWSIFLA